MFGIRPLFWLIYVLVPLALLAGFAWKRPRWAPLASLICPVLDFIVFFREFLYYESRPLVLFITLIQFFIVTALSLLILWEVRH